MRTSKLEGANITGDKNTISKPIGLPENHSDDIGAENVFL